MSTTLDSQHRAVMDRVGELAVADLVRVWHSLPRRDTARMVADLVEVVPQLADRWGDVAAVSASDYFDAVREHYNPAGTYLAQPAPPAPAEQVKAGVRWAVDPMFSASPDETATLARLSTSLDRLVRQADRDTVVDNTRRDRSARAWRRIARPGACAFCLMLTTRGGDYGSQAAAETVGHGHRGRIRGTRRRDESYHDHCRCFAAPVYLGWEPDPVTERAEELYSRARGDLREMRRLLSEAS